MASFIAAGTAGATHGVQMIPFYTFYSMFGMQRTGDQVWQMGDMRGRGFLMAATAGRTTLNGEGLQHQDGHSLLLATAVPNLQSYEPTYAYELAIIVEDGLRRMYAENEDIFYYITLQNEPYDHLALPEDRAEEIRDGLLKGLYRLLDAPDLGAEAPRVRLLGSGSVMQEVLRARTLLAERFGVAAEVYSATSYQTLRREALQVRRTALFHPEEQPAIPHVTQILGGRGAADAGPVVAASDWVRLVMEQIAPFVPGGVYAMGTDGFGRSDTRPSLRRFFEVDAECITLAALYRLADDGQVHRALVGEALKILDVDPAKAHPLAE